MPNYKYDFQRGPDGIFLTRYVDTGTTDPETGQEIYIPDVNVTVQVNDAQARGPVTDDSGTTVGGASQQVIAQNTSRKFLFFQNTSHTTMFINFGAAATNGSPSIQIAPADTWTSEKFFIPTDAVYVWCSVAGKSFTAKEG